ncbi:MAG: cytochrome c maturation protein CcmE [Myxococcales bacterium]|nr:cytochrome c maturation protein CcmE [Myxococcota bacterium]MDW8281884.1 cytochrome c maturation protein CcmE [Myxococcales bacterium]
MSNTSDTLPRSAEGAATESPPLRMAKRGRHRPLLIGLSLAVVIGGLGFLMADSAGFEYYKHVDEVLKEPAAWKDKRLQLHGFVVPGSILKRIDRDRQKIEYKFRTENCGSVVEARFAGVVPDTFKDGAEVVLKGTFDGKTFHTQEVMAKCPSKYAQAGEQQSQMITRCARDRKATRVD